MQHTPDDIVQRQRIRITAEMNYEAEQAKERKEQQAEADRKREELERKRGLTR